MILRSCVTILDLMGQSSLLQGQKVPAARSLRSIATLSRPETIFGHKFFLTCKTSLIVDCLHSKAVSLTRRRQPMLERQHSTGAILAKPGLELVHSA